MRLESFVRIRTPHISIATLLLHTVLGCCWHHGHDGTKACDDIAAHNSEALQGTASACFHNHLAVAHLQASGPLAANHQHSDRIPAPHDSTCDEPSCVFVRADSSPVINLVAESSYSPAAMLCFAAGARDGWIEEVAQVRLAATPLRPHLLYQILLI
jgi:hypothetical protein